MASSIPILRVLVREVKATTARRLYGRSASDSDDSYQKKSYGDASLARSNTVISATKVKQGESQGAGMKRIRLLGKPRSNGGSEKSVLGTAEGGILQTQVVEVRYHERGEGDVVGMDGLGDNRA